MDYILNKIKGQDSYGHTIALNFNRKGKTINTIFGGLITILAKTYLIYIFVSKTIIMFEHGDTTIRNYHTPVDFEKEGPYNFDEANMLIYFMFYCDKKCGDSIYWNLSDEELEENFEWYSTQREVEDGNLEYKNQ